MNESHLLPNLWQSITAQPGSVEELVQVSNLLGADPRITNFGGGNTSSKLTQVDPLTGESEEVLWVKASGGDLGSAKRNNFASLYQSKVLALEQLYCKKNLHEDAIVPLYMHCVFDNNPAAPSIDTPLHAYVPFSAVSHMHSDAVIAIAASADVVKLTEDVFEGKMGYLPWVRPGFELGLMLRNLIRENPTINSAMMAAHGFICWADNWEKAYGLTIDLINQAANYIKRHEGKVHAFGNVVKDRVSDSDDVLIRLLPMLRGKCAFNGQRLIANVNRSEAVLSYLEREKMPMLAELGTSCPDHFLRTKIRPLIVPHDTDSAGLDRLLAKFRDQYAAYYNRCRKDDSPAMRNPNPSIVLIPGVGMVSFSKHAPEARITGEFYRNAIAVMEGAETVSKYVALPEQEAFNIEYWLLEEAKLRRMPPEKELSRRVVVLVGSGPGIGRAIADRVLSEGAHVVFTDIQSSLVDDAVEMFGKKYGKEYVAGETLDKTNRDSVRKAFEAAVLRYGGIDALIDVSAIFVPPNEAGKIDDDAWRKTIDINFTGSYILADEANRIFQAQGTPASIVLTSSANAVVAKKASLAYDTSKAALSHLVRELAVEMSPIVRVNAVAPATVVAGSQQFPRERVMSSLRKYAVPFDDSESEDQLRSKLAEFYARRTLLKQPVTPEKVAEAAFLLISDRLSQTTGQTIAVDAGLPEAFLR